MGVSRFFFNTVVITIVVSAETIVAQDRGIAAITLAPGLKIEQVAAPPVVDRPLMGSFDHQGRLYLAESAGLNLEAKDLLAKTPNFIRRLEDADGDGTFEKSTVFADKMTFPMGALWHRGSIYSASPPYIWKLTDADDDGVADRREILVGKFGFIGNAADIHGCFLGPNGRIYWCDGRHGHEFVDEKGNVKSRGKAARIFSCQLDGSDLTSHAGGGMDNPVEVDFTPDGEMLGVVNLFYPKRGDCLVHWQWGGAYPREDQPLQIAEFKRTGNLLGPVHDFGHVAVSGVIRARSTIWGEGQNWFVCQFNTHKIVRVELKPAGSSYVATVHPVLASNDPDFHPTDVIEDADGSILVIDTGGWFRNGCPTSQVAKPDVLGAIYRIRPTEREAVADPRGLTLPWKNASIDQLIAWMSDKRPAVVERAIDEAAQLGDPATKPLAEALHADGSASVSALWSLARIGTPVAIQSVIHSLDTTQKSDVRHAALVALQSASDPRAIPSLIRELKGENPAEARAAAVALGRMRARTCIPALLKLLPQASNDRNLEHALIYALIVIDDREAALAGLTSVDSIIRRGALIALDQMNSGNLTRELVAPLLDTSDQSLQRAAIDIVAKHSGWSEEIITVIGQWLDRNEIDQTRHATARGVLTSLSSTPSIQQFVGDRLSAPGVFPASKNLLLEVVAQTDLAQLPVSWKEPLVRALRTNDESLTYALSAARPYARELSDALQERASDKATSEQARFEATQALGRAGLPLPTPLFDLVRSRFSPKASTLERLAAAETLGSAELSDSQKLMVAKDLALAGPFEIRALLPAFEKPPVSDAVGQTLVEALKTSTGLSSLSVGRLETLFAGYSSAIQSQSQELVKLLAEQGKQQVARLVELESTLNEGNAERGESIFHGSKASCSACHTVAGKGGRIGPDLSTIGTSRTKRDLLESIVLPSASLARGFESFAVLTKDGRVHTGLIARESLDDIWLYTAERSEVRISREEIDEVTPSSASAMPEGLDRLLSRDDLADLIAYLSSRR